MPKVTSCLCTIFISEWHLLPDLYQLFSLSVARATPHHHHIHRRISSASCLVVVQEPWENINRGAPINRRHNWHWLICGIDRICNFSQSKELLKWCKIRETIKNPQYSSLPILNKGGSPGWFLATVLVKACVRAWGSFRCSVFCKTNYCVHTWHIMHTTQSDTVVTRATCLFCFFFT